MTYAAGRRVVDADSHLMEWPTFLTDHAPAAARDALPPISGGSAGLRVQGSERAPGEREALVALGDDLVRRGPKWYPALGAVDPAERAQALDLLGFEHQVVFSSLCASLFFLPDPALRAAGYAAHNRSMAGFCAADPRLLGVALGELDDRVTAQPVLEEALDQGLRLVWIPARAPGDRSPGHPDHDWFWATLAERGVPFVLHVGSGPLPIGAPWMDDGRPPGEQMVGAEIIGSKDMTVIHHPAMRFLSVLVLDGLLERFPGLRGGAIEMGAGWMPDLLRRLDHAVDIWSRSEPRLGTFTRRPSEQAAEQLRVTPYPFESVAGFMAESDPRLYLFSSDYPHAEGGRDPMGRFDRALTGSSEATRSAFYATNASGWLGL